MFDDDDLAPPIDDPELDAIDDDALPADDEEFDSPPPAT